MTDLDKDGATNTTTTAATATAIATVTIKSVSLASSLAALEEFLSLFERYHHTPHDASSHTLQTYHPHSINALILSKKPLPMPFFSLSLDCPLTIPIHPFKTSLHTPVVRLSSNCINTLILSKHHHLPLLLGTSVGMPGVTASLKHHYSGREKKRGNEDQYYHHHHHHRHHHRRPRLAHPYPQHFLRVTRLGCSLSFPGNCND